MKERGIIMSGDNPKLILNGSKTMTRRIVKLKFPFSAGIAEVAGYHMGTTPTPPVDMRVVLRTGVYHHMDFKTFAEKYCPYGVAGDRLWVRETWAHNADLKAYDSGGGYYFYRSDHPTGLYHDNGDRMRWRSPYHMPRNASRIRLELTGVRVERLQDISEADAKAEGVDAISQSDTRRQATWNRRQDYAHLWDSLHGKGAWERNPWVWVLEFRPK